MVMLNNNNNNHHQQQQQNEQQLHFIMVPLLAQGHYIPMLDLARLLASRKVHVTVVTTPLNASRVEPIISRANLAGAPVRLLVLDFHCSQFGLPEGCESIELLPETRHISNYFDALEALQLRLSERLREVRPRPSCIVADYCMPWTKRVAVELGVPRLVFHGPSCFYLLCLHYIVKHGIEESVVDENEAFVVPEMPVRVEITRAKAMAFYNFPGVERLRESTIDAEATADGLIMNTFEELEGAYVSRYEEAAEKRVWAVGPVSLCNGDASDRAERGKKCSIEPTDIISWLDSREENSVVYVSFGTVTHYNRLSLMEIGLGLEASKTLFIWVIKERELESREFREFVDEFERRIKTRGLIIRGWSPQTLVLSHKAVGAFMTHCGWNSTLEALAAGVPMVTWPYYADQFLNEKLVVEVLRIGVSVGARKMAFLAGEEEVVIKREEVEKAIVRMMDRGEEGDERRKRAKKLANEAIKAMSDGGSSYKNLSSVIEYIKHLANKDNK